MSRNVGKKASVEGSPFDSVKPVEDVKDDLITFVQTPANSVRNAPTPVQTPQAEDLAEEKVEEQQDSVGEEVQTEEDEDVNPYEYLGRQLHADGYLDQEFAVDKTIKGGDLYNAYTSKLRKEIEPKIKSQVMSELEQAGINEHALTLAKMIQRGEDVTLLNQVNLYERLAQHDKNATPEQKEQKIRQMYAVRGSDEYSTNAILEKIKADEKLDEQYNISSQFFKAGYDETILEQDRQYEVATRQQKELVEKQNNHIRGKLSSLDIHGRKLDKQQAREIENAIYDATETVEIAGKKYSSTKFQKFLAEMQADPELAVWAYTEWTYRDKNLDHTKKEIKKEVEQDFIKEYKKAREKTNKPGVAVKKQLDKQTSNGRSFIIEL